MKAPLYEQFTVAAVLHKCPLLYKYCYLHHQQILVLVCLEIAGILRDFSCPKILVFEASIFLTCDGVMSKGNLSETERGQYIDIVLLLDAFRKLTSKALSV